MPRYQEIFLEMAERIRSGAYPAGSLLPGEHRLMEEFDVSRDTVRKALSLLSRYGYIEKSRGRGSTVIYPSPSIIQPGSMGFYEYSVLTGCSPRTEILRIEPVRNERCLSQLPGMSADTPVFRVDRVRYKDNVPCAVETNYLNGSLLSCPSAADAEKSLYDFIEHTCSQLITSIRRQTSCVKADAPDAEHLQLPEGTMLVRILSTAMNKSGTILMYSIVRYSPESYVYEEFLQRSLKL